MKRYAILFFSVVMIFWGCEEKMIRIIELGGQLESEEEQFIEEQPIEEVLTIEKIVDLANKGTLDSALSKAAIERDTTWTPEGINHAKVIWLNKGEKDEVQINFKPNDSTKVFRVTVKGRENKLRSLTGVRTGLSIDQVNSLNRKPVDFYGFNWDFGGMAIFNDGALEESHLYIYFKTDKKVAKHFIGDTPHSFEATKKAKRDLYVNKIIDRKNLV